MIPTYDDPAFDPSTEAGAFYDYYEHQYFMDVYEETGVAMAWVKDMFDNMEPHPDDEIMDHYRQESLAQSSHHQYYEDIESFGRALGLLSRDGGPDAFYSSQSAFALVEQVFNTLPYRSIEEPEFYKGSENAWEQDFPDESKEAISMAEEWNSYVDWYDMQYFLEGSEGAFD